MRGTKTIIGRRIPNPNAYLPNLTTKHTPFSLSSSSSSPFSTSSGSFGRGRGRGGSGGDSPFAPGQFDFTPKAPGKPNSDESKPDSPELQPSGRSHGRGRPLPSNPSLPSLSSFISSIKPGQSGVGRGRGVTESGSIRFTESRPESPPAQPPPPNPQFTPSATESVPLPSGIVSGLPGAGRGTAAVKPVAGLGPTQQTQQQQENRHIEDRYKHRPRRQQEARGGVGRPGQAPPKTQSQSMLNVGEAVKKAMDVLSADPDHGDDGHGRGGGGGRAGRWKGKGKGRARMWLKDEERGEVGVGEDVETVLHLGDNADGEKLAKRIGMENMNLLAEGFEEISGRILPSPMDDAYLEALHTNYMIEFEPEYLMGAFDENPDIDEKPPMPLQDVLEKVKPFIVAYEGIQSQEEWEEAVEETMKNVPLLKEIVDYYSGPDRVTAKKQQEELERVAKTIPPSAPVSVRQFTDQAVLSLQSNPGWGFDKKCQFMDKLVWEVSHQYK